MRPQKLVLPHLERRLRHLLAPEVPVRNSFAFVLNARKFHCFWWHRRLLKAIQQCCFDFWLIFPIPWQPTLLFCSSAAQKCSAFHNALGSRTNWLQPAGWCLPTKLYNQRGHLESRPAATQSRCFCLSVWFSHSYVTCLSRLPSCSGTDITSFNENLSYATLRWELRTSRPAAADDGPSQAMNLILSCKSRKEPHPQAKWSTQGWTLSPVKLLRPPTVDGPACQDSNGRIQKCHA